MIKKTDQHIFQGMQRDMSVSKQQPQFLWEAHNIRLTAREGDTLMSVTNEKGTEKLTFNTGELGKSSDGSSQEQIMGTYVGHCVIGDYLTVFTHSSDGDYIFRIHKEEDGSFSLKCLTGTKTVKTEDDNGSVIYTKAYRSLQLNLSEEHPLQTLGVYENENIQKVYWTDGVNQPRMINIVKDSLYDSVTYTENSFDFVPKMALEDSISIKKKADSSSSFGAGMIQYAVTYYNKYGQETNISCTSELIPTSFTDRAGDPEEKIGNTFEVTVTKPDTDFEYLRLYSIFRSSLNGTASCKRVADVDLSTVSASYTLTKGKIWNTQEMEVEDSLQIMTSYPDGYKDFTESDYSSLLQDVTMEDGSTQKVYVFDSQDYPDLVLKVTGTDGVTWYITYGYGDMLYVGQSYSDSQNGNLRVVYGYEYGTGITASFEYSDSMTVEKSVASVLVVDNGTIGDDIDAEELLYVGGESITAETIEQKDGTLFLGNIEVTRPTISDDIKALLTATDSAGNLIHIRGGQSTSWCTTATYQLKNVLTGTYTWGNQLNATLNGNAASTAGFKHGEHYRLGIQFQYNTGKWSEPLFLKDVTQDEVPSYDTEEARLVMPTFAVELSDIVKEELIKQGYVRARGMVVMPSASDKLIVAQGVLNPTVYSVGLAENHAPDYQSSWFFRPWHELNDLGDDETGSYVSNGNGDYVSNGAFIQCKHGRTLYGAGRAGCGFIGSDGISSIPVSYSRGTEIQGTPPDLADKDVTSISDKMTLHTGADSDNDDKDVTKDMLITTFAVDQQYVTMHSPEFEFDTSFSSLDTVSLSLRVTGRADFKNTAGYISIETATPPISSESNGFYNRTITTKTNVRNSTVYYPSGGNSQFSARRLCAGLFYRDWITDDTDKTTFEPINQEKLPLKEQEYGFMVYPWHRTGSLNNDCNRPSGGGTRSGELSRKIISNFSFTETSYFTDGGQELSLAHGSNNIQCYLQENVTLLKVNGKNYYADVDELLMSPTAYGYAISSKPEDFGSDIDIWSDSKYWCDEGRVSFTEAIGDNSKGLRITSEAVRMKYKSTSHAVIALDEQAELKEPDSVISNYDGTPLLYIAELYREASPDTDFGGDTEQAYQSNLWLPAGYPVRLDDDSQSSMIEYRWGDTWFQRYDCLKTYSYTDDDTNSVIEIGSFMLETHVNIDGRYDKSRGHDSNMSASPENFNKINTVYSQLNNYFNYRILDNDYYKLSKFPSMLTWSEAKNNASDVDAWTTVTLASTLELDGTNGEVTALVTDRDSLYAFQEKGLSQVLFNSRVAISTSDNVPIEISNNYKVDGNRYISTSVGCYNKFAIAKSPAGVYFVDGIGNVLYLLNEGQLTGISESKGFNYWFSQQETQTAWKPGVYYPTATQVHVNPYIIYVDDLQGSVAVSGARKASKAGGASYMVNAHGWLNSRGLALYYDFNKKDLYVLTPKEALCYSELLQQFVSFMDYEGGILFNIGTTFHALTNSTKKSIDFWEMFAGGHNTFFYDRHKTDLTFVSNAENTLDKTFTNMEMRADFYSEDGELQHNRFFDTVRTTDEYQDTGDTKLVYKTYPYTQSSVVSNTKKKFRIWRCEIPRAMRNGRRSMDRIRNTWCKINLAMNRHVEDEGNTEEAYSMELHDVGVIYYV